MDGSRSKNEIMEEKVTKVNFLCLEQLCLFSPMNFLNLKYFSISKFLYFATFFTSNSLKISLLLKGGDRVESAVCQSLI